jgi:nucleotide-binding universal stress UspA family protein
LERIFAAVLKTAEEKTKKRAAMNVFTRLERGNPDETIVEIAKEGVFDLIVIGSRGLGRRDFALGSVSSRVAENDACPVLIVK